MLSNVRVSDGRGTGAAAFPGPPQADISQPMSAIEGESLYEKVLRQLAAAGKGGPAAALPAP
ncbi:MAG: hypothetical protein QOJ16_1197, partial [Acidobacteriota bacterium]|nr:hypothetical protein [Acidobacteriota bacterium]